MLQTVLVPLTGFDSDVSALETAYLIAKIFDSDIHCIYFSSAWIEIAAELAATDATMPSGEIYAALDQGRRQAGERARRHFAEFCQRRNVTHGRSASGPRSVSAHMREIRGDVGGEVVAEGQFYDLIVLSRTPEGHGFGSTIINVGRPVVLAPNQVPERFGSTVAIAWKRSAEAARALTAAMPILVKAKEVIVVAADEGAGPEATMGSAERAAAYLRQHDLVVETECVAIDQRSAASAIVQAALAKKADLLVMVAYGHSRLRELVLGGMTREVLTDCPIPVFLFH